MVVLNEAAQKKQAGCMIWFFSSLTRVLNKSAMLLFVHETRGLLAQGDVWMGLGLGEFAKLQRSNVAQPRMQASCERISSFIAISTLQSFSIKYICASIVIQTVPKIASKLSKSLASHWVTTATSFSAPNYFRRWG